MPDSEIVTADCETPILRGTIAFAMRFLSRPPYALRLTRGLIACQITHSDDHIEPLYLHKRAAGPRLTAVPINFRCQYPASVPYAASTKWEMKDMPLVNPHGGGELQPLLLEGAERAGELRRAQTLPKVRVSSREKGD